jgi:FtsP/CotA-like multicopper oxidase with cupredoxin domain
MTVPDIKRRELLRLLAAGTLIKPVSASAAEHTQAVITGMSKSPLPDPAFNPDLELDLVAEETTQSLLPGEATRLWRYRGRVIAGDQAAFSTLPGGQIPVIRVRKGQRLRIFFKNEIPEQTIVHWHGLHIRQKMDGHPMYVIDQGEQYVYEFVVRNRAGTYWFHPHPHRRTGIQVYRGMVGLFIVEDDEEAMAGLPSGRHELTWVLHDKRLSSDNQLIYARNHMEMMMGFSGDQIFVNGRPDHVEEISATAYRIRILNGSSSLFYKLAWRAGRPMTLIASDGGLLEQPVQKSYVMLAPAERIELWMDFSGDPHGTEHVLQSLSFNAGSMGMGMGMGMGRGMGMGMMGAGSRNGRAFDVLKVRVTSPGEKPRSLPEQLSRINWPDINDAVNRDTPRLVRLQMGRGQVSLNDRVFDMMDVAQDEIVKLDTTEVWEFRNDNAMMSHPMHVHNVQFRVIERSRNSRYRSVHTSMQDGFTDEGLKDVVTVMPGERVRVLLHFSRYTGIYLYHCHILEHEDLGMMRNYLIES